MPDFVQPPQILNWSIELCEDACQTIPTLEGLALTINGFLSDWYNWLTSDSFPNVFYVPDEDKFYYYDGEFKPFVDFPNVFMLNGTLRHKLDTGNSEAVPASAIDNNVFYLEGQAEYLRLADGTTNGKAIYPFTNCVRYSLSDGKLQYHDGTGWQDFSIGINQGALIIQSGVVKYFQGSQYLTANLPYRNGDLKEIGGYIWKYQDLVWTKFYWEGQVMAKADDSGLDVYRNGQWQHLATFAYANTP